MTAGRACRWLGAAALGAAAAVAGPSGVGPATADCITAEAWYSLLGGPQTYVVPAGTCMTPTPFDDCVDAGVDPREPGTLEAEVRVGLVCPD